MTLDHRSRNVFREITRPALVTGFFLLFVIISFTFSWFNDHWEYYSVMASLVPFLGLFLPVLAALFLSQLTVQKEIARKKKIKNTLLIHFFVGCLPALLMIVIGGIATLTRGYDTDVASFLVGFVYLCMGLVLLVPNYVYFYKKNRNRFQ